MKTKVQLARTLIAAIEGGSIAEGARALNITRSAASKNIAALETALGMPLLLRNSKQIALTEAGGIYVHGIRAALAHIEAVESDVSAYAEYPAGVLTIESSVLFARYHLNGIVRDYLHCHPRMTVDLRLNDGRADVASGEVDLYFRTGHIKHQDMVATRLMDICFRTVASPDYLLRNGTPASINALEDHNCLNFRFPADHSLFQWRFRIDEDVVHQRFSGNLISTDAEELLKAVLNGDGVSQLPNQLVDSYIRKGSLVELFPETVYADKTLYMCVQRSRRNDIRLSSFRAFLRAAMENGDAERVI
ncbi:MAG: LysR family transcriptional regulator [Pseudomonadota bacterium]